MSKEKRRVPKLRFPGFTEDWEQRKLNDLVTIRRGLTYKPSDIAENGIRVLRSSNIDEDQFITSNDDVFVNIEAVNIPFAKNGDILITSANGSNRLVGKHTIIRDIADNSAVHGGFMLLAESNNPLFTDALLSSNWYKRFINTYVAGGNGAIGNLSKSDLESQIVMVPSEHEQAKIGQWYDNINQLITLHQRKLDNLKLKKKALLQKLFPKNGERYPELRFPEFTDAWEQRKLIDIAKTFIGLVTTMTENYRDSGTLLIRNSDIKEGQFLFSENPIHLDEEFAEKNKTRRLQIGDVVTVHTGDIGTSAVIEEKEAGAIGFATINTRTDKSILNPYFLATYFNTEKHKCYANSVSTGDGRSNYNIKDFNKLVISVPTLDEQERISVLINDINIIITLHQRKLDHLQLQKKALLQQMFV